MAYTDDYDHINDTLKQWYYYFSNMYNNDYSIYNNSIRGRLDKIIEDKKNAKRMKELVLFHQLTKRNDLHIISTIMIGTLTSKGSEQLLADTYNNVEMDKFYYDLRYMYEIIQNCIKMMDYLHTKYDYLYVDYWRNKDAVHKYIQSAYQKYNKVFELFETAKSSIDLLQGYNFMFEITYDGLMITEYIRLMNCDALLQGNYCNELHIFNISQEFFTYSRYERDYISVINTEPDESDEDDYDYEDDYDDYEDDRWI
jgi:hypothetical protein